MRSTRKAFERLHSKRLPPGTEIVNLSVQPLRPMRVQWTAPTPFDVEWDEVVCIAQVVARNAEDAKLQLALKLGCARGAIRGIEVLE